MGNKQSVDDGTYNIAIQNLVFEKKCSDSRFGDVKWLIDPKNGTKVLQKDVTINTAKDYERYLNQIKKRSGITHPKIIRILGHSTKQEDAFCANFYKISVYFEAFEYDLEEDLQYKIERKQLYTEEELWNVISSVVSACAFLQSNNEFHGDIRPFNILFTQGKDCKILDNAVLKKSTLSTYLAHVVDLEDKSRLYSPEQFSSLVRERETSEKIDYDHYKSDVFSLGMTILQCAGLKNIDDLYDWKKFEIEFTQIEQRLEALNETYSPNLVNIIRWMLKPQETDRPDFLQLESKISQHHKTFTGHSSEHVTITANRTENAKNAGYRATPDEHQDEVHHDQNHMEATPQFIYDEDELDRRIKRVLEKSAEAIRNSPVKQIAHNSDAYFEHFMNNFKASHGITSFTAVSTPYKNSGAEDPNKSGVQHHASPGSHLNSSIHATPNANANHDPKTSPSALIVSPSKYGTSTSNYKPYVSPATNGNAYETAGSNKYGSYLSNYQPYVPKSGTNQTYQPRTYASTTNYAAESKV